MASFTTCFTPEWHYHTVFECESPKEAFLLEQSVLYCLAEKRVPQRELLRATEEEVVAVARAVVTELNLSSIEKGGPDHRKQDFMEEAGEALQGLARPCGVSGCEETMPDTETSASSPLIASVEPYTRVLNRLRDRIALVGTLGLGGASPEEATGVDETSFFAEWSELEGLTTQHHPGFGLVDSENYTLEMLRPYQVEAVERVKRELETKGKAICQMACRCGKTPVAFAIMKDYLRQADQGRSARLLYLVPGLFLLRQTAKKLFHYGLDAVPLLLIGSDPNPVFLDATHSVTMTTDPTIIQDTLRRHERLLVLSTYHSSPLLEQMNVFALTVFDECHRLCGSASKTPFNTILRLTPSGHRLFLTATPTYDTPVRMNDAELFGGIAYRYYLREGIDAGFVNPYSVRIVLGSSMENMNPYFIEAMGLVNKMLVFCKNIEHAEALSNSLRHAAAEQELGGVGPFKVLVAHSRMGGAAVAGVLEEFAKQRRAVLFNVRLFQEGVEIPDLNAVFFAAPRFSSRDIIQSICRPLNKLPNKPTSYVFLPAVMNPHYAEDHPINLHNYSTLVPFTDALMEEDPTLFEYMLDPQKKHYDINVIGVRALKLTTDKVHKFILPAIRRGVRYSHSQTDRLHRAARMPWKQAFGELRRIVLECNRYPKVNDAWVVGDSSVSMSLFYRYVRRGYALYMDGQQTYLEKFQICDLESLPSWKPYGVEGPYPWNECLQTLASHLAQHGNPPPLEVHKGGFVGLDATPFERLSGFLMRINQSDGKNELRLPPDKQRDLDRLCQTYGLCWRKQRNKKSGVVLEGSTTFITTSYEQFKLLLAHADQLPVFKRYLNEHFPGYPEKHMRMENIQRLHQGKVPPRHQPRRRKQSAAQDDVDIGAVRGNRSVEPTVMCRVCRTHVKVSEYKEHIESPAHLEQQESCFSSR